MRAGLRWRAEAGFFGADEHGRTRTDTKETKETKRTEGTRRGQRGEEGNPKSETNPNKRTRTDLHGQTRTDTDEHGPARTKAGCVRGGERKEQEEAKLWGQNHRTAAGETTKPPWLKQARGLKREPEPCGQTPNLVCGCFKVTDTG